MPNRHRESNGEFQVCGTYHNYTVNPPQHTPACLIHGPFKECDDVIDNWEGVNPLSIYDRFTYYPTMGGQEKHVLSGAVIREFDNYPIAYRPGAPDPRVQFADYTSLVLSNMAWTILAATNPNVPHVSVPTFYGELKDLPDLVNRMGKSLLERAASGYLSWRWCIRPMIGDLRKLLKFTKAVDDRIMWLMRLRDGNTLRRRCHLGKSTFKPAPFYGFLHSQGATIKGWRQVTYTEEVWGTAQWKLDPSSNLPKLGYGPLKFLAQRMALGFTSHEALSTFWELTPWSWLVDWFTNVGDVIAATNNTVALTWDKVCLMRTRTAWSEYTKDKNASSSWPTFNGWYVEKCVRKERQIVFPITPVPVPFLPILDGGKLSILASLAALRL